MPISSPWFWFDDGFAAKTARASLLPAAAIYDLGQQLRAATTKAKRGRVPVICVGNASVGGVGKTPFALRLSKALAPLTNGIFFLTRGYGGARRGPVRVSGDHAAHDVGDEPLLLAAQGPTIVARDRPAGAALAADLGARLIIMDDGYQNPTIAKDVAILLAGAEMNANHAILPAGPMREPLARAASRADVIVTIGGNGQPIVQGNDESFRTVARLSSIGAPKVDSPVLAFCGIARPDRFFETLRRLGAELVDAVAFPDHHPFSDAELDALDASAKKAGARLITTAKDAARLPSDRRAIIDVLEVEMRIDNEDGLVDRIATLLDARRPEWRDA
ncbi:MAG: tetraacyldisaccharide 4'-kinase [Pseudomonadota bacterium]